MTTDALYLKDSYLKQMEATVFDLSEEGGKKRIILDKTVFYPMGGGQPTDQGVIEMENTTSKVYQVMFKEGEIWHFLEGNTIFEKGMKVRGKIDWERRYKNMRVHTAGHLIDFALYLLGYSPGRLKPQKADHGRKPYIIYEGTAGEDFREKVQEKIEKLISNNLSITSDFVSLKDLEKDAIYLQPGLPKDKPLRKITLEGVGSVADGGTQVAKTGEAGKIEITDIQELEDIQTTIYYRTD